VGPRLVRQLPLVDLGPAVKTAGFLVADYGAVLSELADFSVVGAPSRAVDKRRAEFLAGRFAAQQALTLLGVDGVPERNDDGSPRWPLLVSGSITHGAERALCAVARAVDVRSLGIDAERLMSASASEELRARICEPAERAVLVESLQVPEHQAVTFAFSAKESLYKCLYPFVGRFMEFHAARVVEAGVEMSAEGLRAELLLELSVDWSAEFRAGRRLPAKLVATVDHVETAVLLGA
jgi:enterobactin synthetase component D